MGKSRKVQKMSMLDEFEEIGAVQHMMRHRGRQKDKRSRQDEIKKARMAKEMLRDL